MANLFMCLNYLFENHNLMTIKDKNKFPADYTEIYNLVKYKENVGVDVEIKGDNKWITLIENAASQKVTKK